MATHRHKRDTNARRLLGARLTRLRATTLAGPLAVAATTGVVSLGVLTADVSPASIAAPAPVVGDTATPGADLVGDVVDRAPSVSRGFAARGGSAVQPERAAKSGKVVRAAKPVKKKVVEPTEAELMMAPDAVREAIAGADTQLWTTTLLNLWTDPATETSKTGEVAPGEQVLVTGRSLLGRVEIVWEKTETRWVTDGYLSEEEPTTLGGECTNGTSVPSGVSPNIAAVHAAVCAQFPEITVYGTFRGDGDHSRGIAVDIMVSGDRGQQVADFVREYYAEFNVNYVIYAQRIWSVERSGEGWRGMEDRGSTTANHYDHVHVSTY